MSDERSFETDLEQHADEASLSPAGVIEESGDAVEFDGVTMYSSKQLGRVRDLLARFSAARRLSRFYPGEHPSVDEAVNDLFATIAIYHSEGADVQLSFHEGEIIFGEQVLTGESIAFDQLVREMDSAGIGTLIFRAGLTAEELRRALPLLAADSVDVQRAGSLEQLRLSCDAPHVFAGEVHIVNDETEAAEFGDEVTGAYSGAVSLVQEIDRLFRANRAVSASKVKGVVRSLVDGVLSNEGASLRLSGLKKFDEYTYYHSVNVAILSIALGSRITNDYRFLTTLGIGSLLHDIGKLALDPEILNKPGALTPQEWALVRRHPVRGAEMAALIPGIDRSAIVAIAEHHMRYDLAGYPRRLPPRPQHLTSRIVAVADSYDAMTSRRAYSAARVQDEAMALIVKISGSSLDPTLVRLFVRLIGVYPPRSVVRLTNGEVAVVLSAGTVDPVLPQVRIIASASGAIIEPKDLDLAETDGVRVVACLDPRTLNVEVEDYL